uniref:Putative secreted protein n=1 Tax=Ixodes scapularis TaxID=6945 RepID=Q4PMK5_IXOSC|nr:putative secreted protein [Ixodes scapularis]
MQVALFIVILTFTHLSREELPESIPHFYREFESLQPECKDKLKTEMIQRCSEHLYQPLLVEVLECTFKCGNEHNNGKTILTSGQYIKLNDGTPCGPNKICIDGQCVSRCSMPFVKGLKGRI